MKRKLTPEELRNSDQYELLTEVAHNRLREFVVEQIREEKYFIRLYSIYQVLMMLIFTYLFTRAIILAIKGFYEPMIGIGLAIAFSFSVLIVLHELLHALAYLLTGARKIAFGFVPGKFIFYALADQQVIRKSAFTLVALTPFGVVKIVTLAGLLLFAGHQTFLYFFLSIMCLHSLFCAGDMAMLAFYNLHKEKEILNFDSRAEGKTYFYVRKQR